MNYNPAFNRVASFREIAHQVSNQSAEPASANQALDDVTAPVLAGARLVANVRVTRGAVDAEALAAELEQAAPGKVRRIKLPANPAELAAFVKKWEAANLAKRMGGAGMLILPLAACGGGGGGGGVFGGGDAGASGFVIDGYVAGAAVSRVNGSGNTVYTEADGSFSGLTGHGPIKVDLSGATDIDRPGFVFPDGTLLTAPDGSTVVTPLTTLVQTLIDSGQTLDQAQDTVKTWLNINDDTDLRNYNFVESQNPEAYIKAQQVLNIVSTATAGGAMTAEQTFQALADLISSNPNASLGDADTVRQALIDSGAGETVANAIASQVEAHNAALEDLIDDDIDFEDAQSGAQTANETHGKNNEGGAGLVLLGTDAQNTLTGTERNDTLIGGRGGDTLTGGDGEDKFVFTVGAESPVVKIAFSSRTPVAGEIYSLKFPYGEGQEYYVWVEVEAGQSLRDVLEALEEKINEAELDGVSAERQGNALVISGIEMDDGIVAQVREGGDLVEDAEIADALMIAHTITFDGEAIGEVAEGQIYTIKLAGKDDITYIAEEGDELEDVLAALVDLINQDDDLNAELVEGEITITSADNAHGVESVTVLKQASEPEDITDDTVSSILVEDAHASAAKFDITDEQAATAGSFSITIAGLNGGEPIEIEDLGEIADGAALAAALEQALRAADGGAESAITVTWADDVLTITDGTGRYLSDASLKTAGTEAEASTAEIGFGSQGPGDAAYFSIKIAGLNDGKAIEVDLSDVEDSLDLTAAIQAALQAQDGGKTDITVTWDGDVNLLTITDAAGRELSEVTMLDAGDLIAHADPEGDISVTTTVAIEFGEVAAASTSGFSITIAGLNGGEPISLSLENLLGAVSMTEIEDGDDLAQALEAALQMQDGETANIQVEWNEDTKTLTITDSQGREISDVSLDYGAAEIHEITLTTEPVNVSKLTFMIGETSVEATVSEVDSGAGLAEQLQTQVQMQVDGKVSVAWEDGIPGKLVIKDADGRQITGLAILSGMEPAGTTSEEQDGGTGTLEGEDVEIETVSSAAFDVTNGDAQGSNTFRITIAGLNDDEPITISLEDIEDGEELAEAIQLTLQTLDEGDDITVGWSDDTLTITDRQARDISDVELRYVSEIDETIDIENGSVAVDGEEIDEVVDYENDSAAVPQVTVVTFEDVVPALGYIYTVTINGEKYSVTVGNDDIAASFSSILAGLKAEIEGDEANEGMSVSFDVDARTLTITGKVDGVDPVAFEVESVTVTFNSGVLEDAAAVEYDLNMAMVSFDDGMEPQLGDTFTVVIGGKAFTVTVGKDGITADFASILGGLKDAIDADETDATDGIGAVTFDSVIRSLTIDGVESTPDIGDDDVFVTRLNLEHVPGSVDDDPVDTISGRPAPEPEPQESVITFEDIEVQDGYTYTVTIEGKTYSVTAGEDDIEDLADVLNALKDAIEADADGEDGHGLSVEVTAQAGQEPGDGTYTLTITGREDGTPFTVGGVTVTEVADVDGALGASPVDTTAGKEVPMAQVSTVTFTGVEIFPGDIYTVTINGTPYFVIAGGDPNLASVLEGLKAEIDQAGLGFRVEVTDDNKLVITGLNDETFTIASNGPEGDTGSVDTDLVPGQWQVSTITFGDVAPEVGYTYKVTINGETYSVTVDGNSIEANLTSVLNGLKAAIDADSEDHGLIVNVTADTEPEDYGLTIIGKEDGTEFEIGTVSVTGDVPDAIHTPPGSGPNTSFMFAFNSGVPANDGYTYTVKIGNNTYSATVGELINGDPLENSLDAVVNRLQELVEDGEEGVSFDVGMGGENNIEVTVFFEPAAPFTLDVSVTGPVFGALEGVETTYEDIAPAAQVSVVTFEEIPVGAGYTYTVTINGTAYDYTAVEGNLWSHVLDGLKAKIEADFEDHGLSVAPDAATLTLTITGKDDGTPFVVGVAVTELANVDVALDDNPIDTTDGVQIDDTQKAEVETTTPASEGVAQVDTVTFSGNVEEGDYFRITIGDHVFAYRAEAEDTLESVRDALLDLINDAELGIVAALGDGDGVELTLTALIPNEFFDATAEAFNSAPQVSTVTFGDVAPDDGYIYTVTINGTAYSVTVGKDEVGDSFASVLAALKDLIEDDEANEGMSVSFDAAARTLTITGKDDGTAFSVPNQGVTVFELVTETVEGAVDEENAIETTEGASGVREKVEVTFQDHDAEVGMIYKVIVPGFDPFIYVVQDGNTLENVLAALAEAISGSEGLEAEVVNGALVITGLEDGSHLSVTVQVTQADYDEIEDAAEWSQNLTIDLAAPEYNYSEGEVVRITVGEELFEEVVLASDIGNLNALATRLAAQINQAEINGFTVTVNGGTISVFDENETPLEVAFDLIGLGDDVDGAIPDDNVTEIGLSDTFWDEMAHITDFVVGEDLIDLRKYEKDAGSYKVNDLDRQDVVWSEDDGHYEGFDPDATLADILEQVLEGLGAHDARFIVIEGGELQGTYLYVNDSFAALDDHDILVNMTGIIGLGAAGDLTDHMEDYFVTSSIALT